MSNDLNKPDFSQVNKISAIGKNVLEQYFGKKYIEVKTKTPENRKNTNNSESFECYTIVKKEKPIYKKINSIDGLDKLKQEIMASYEENIIDYFWDLFDKVEDQIDDSTIKSLEILGKTFENRKKKMGSAFKKLKPEPLWDIDRIQKEFSYLLKNVLEDILNSTLDSISNGIKNSQFSVYDNVLNIVNNFLSKLGIYTKEYKVGDKCDNELDNLNIRPSDDKEIKSKDYQDIISSVDSLAYLFEEDFPVREASVAVWRVS